MSVLVTSGDTQPLLTLTLYTDPSKATPLDLTSATSVTWHIRAGTSTASKVATISNAAGGVTTWQWDGEPLLPAGLATITPVVAWGDGTVETAVAGEQFIISEAAA